MSEKTIFRVHKKNGDFFIMHKSVVETSKLSYKAKGILAYLLSKPDNWKVYLSDVENHSTDGRQAIQSGIKELEDAGYIYRKPAKDLETGKLTGWEWNVYETPSDGKTDKRKTRLTGNPSDGKPATTNNDLTKNKRTNNYFISSANDDPSNDSRKAIYAVWEKYQPITILVANELDEQMAVWIEHADGLPEDHPDKLLDVVGVISEAINEMAKYANKPSRNYFRAIIENWVANGYKVDTRQKADINKPANNSEGGRLV